MMPLPLDACRQLLEDAQELREQGHQFDADTIERVAISEVLRR